MFKVQRNKKTPNVVEFYHKEYKDGKEPEITLDENDGTLILYKTFKKGPIEINVLFQVKTKKEKRSVTDEEMTFLASQFDEKCSHFADEGRIMYCLMDYDWFESGYNRHKFT